MTKLQGETLARVIRAHENGQWYRAQGSGERVTLASLFRSGVLDRRAWRGTAGEADAANEYRPSKVTLDAWREKIAESRRAFGGAT